MKKLLSAVLMLCLILGLGGCKTKTKPALKETMDKTVAEKYTKVTTANGFAYCLDDQVIQVPDEQQENAQLIRNAVMDYVENVLYAPHKDNYHRMDSPIYNEVDWRLICENDLALELNMRGNYIAEKSEVENLSQLEMYVRYDTFDIKDDTAKVIITTKLKNPDTNDVAVSNHEGYIFRKDGEQWKLVNNIMDTGRGGDKILKELAENDNPEDWRTKYSYGKLKRSDYEKAHDFIYFGSDIDSDIDPAKVKVDE